jgi:hypothetical protein
MKVKKFKKMYLKKTAIAKINSLDIQKIKGGTRSFDPPTGLDTHCGEYVCF